MFVFFVYQKAKLMKKKEKTSIFAKKLYTLLIFAREEGEGWGKSNPLWQDNM